jgi:RimJ/RimL family protein N-acetyltransferase
MPLPTDVPVLATARLRLRGHTLGDFDSSFALWSNPEVTRHIGGRPSTREETWSRLLRYAGHWALLGFGYWVVEERDSHRFVGEVGFADFKRELEPPLNGMPEMGWVLAPAFQGKGYATEAISAGLAWGDGHFKRATIACLIDAGNAPSIRVATTCGFKPMGPATYKGAPTLLFKR